MDLSFHSGLCCGIKTIHSLPSGPHNMVSALKAVKPSNPDQYGHNVETSDRLFFKEAPTESGKDRLDRYLAFLREHRPKGVVEIILAEGPYMDQVTPWHDTLTERDFECVTRARNSNSGNTIHIYHLIMNEPTPDDCDDDCDD